MAIPMPAMDAMFFISETAASPKHVGALQVFELPAKAPRDYLKKLVAQLRANTPEPPFNYRPHFPRAGMPQWEIVERPDMDYHVRYARLPAPGDTARLLAYVEHLHIDVLDRTRPCWFCQIIGGLEGGRFAMYTKIHHACIDGMSGVRRMYAALTESPQDTSFQAAWAYREKRQPRRAPPDAARRVTRLARAALAQARALGELYETFARLGLQWAHVHDSYHQVPFDAPRSLMNHPLERAGRAVAVCSLPLDRVRKVAASAGGKVNDVVLAVVDGALHDYLAARGRGGEGSGERLVALCPMSLREDGDDSATTQVAALHVRMGEPGAAMHERLAQIVESSRQAKADARRMSREAMLEFGVLMFGVFELFERTHLLQRLPPSYNVLVSNVPGPPGGPLYMLGSRLVASYPISTFLPGTNLNVTVLSHGNSLDFGMMADRQAMPDIARLATAIERRFAELGRTRGRRRSGARM
jgi:WS/DGAT/MGAT family acyltransferase